VPVRKKQKGARARSAFERGGEGGTRPGRYDYLERYVDAGPSAEGLMKAPDSAQGSGEKDS